MSNAAFQSKLRQAALNAQRKADRALQQQRRKAERLAAEERRTREIQADGFNQTFKAKLINAQKKLHDDPRSAALVARAERQMGVEQLRREHGMGSAKPAPGFEMGRPIDTGAPAKTVAEQMAERRALQQPVAPLPETKGAPVAHYQPPRKGKR